MMDYDPDFYEDEMYDEGYGDGYEDGQNDVEGSEEPEVERDELGNPIFLGAAAGFGYHMSEDERESLEEGLEEQDRAESKVKKVPLSSRNDERKGPKGGYKKATKGTPFERWAHDVNRGLRSIDEDIEYTPEEEKRIIKNEIIVEDEF